MTEEMPTEGQPAPDFTLPSTEGRDISLKDLRGKNVVLYFYPKDDTPGCTKEACSFRDSLKAFEEAGAAVLGISLDDLKSHEKFRSKYDLSFPLLSDTDAHVAKAYGVYRKKKLYGREFWGVQRATFVIDKDGIIRKVFPKVKVDGHSEEVLDFIRRNM
jgi:peroxiredoxin Q/BCP